MGEEARQLSRKAENNSLRDLGVGHLTPPNRLHLLMLRGPSQVWGALGGAAVTVMWLWGREAAILCRVELELSQSRVSEEMILSSRDVRSRRTTRLQVASGVGDSRTQCGLDLLQH